MEYWKLNYDKPLENEKFKLILNFWVWILYFSRRKNKTLEINNYHRKYREE